MFTCVHQWECTNICIYPWRFFPQHMTDQFDLNRKAKDGKVYSEIRRSVYGLPQSGKHANEYLKAKLAPTGCYEVPHTPGLWKHISCPVKFTLVVDNFGVKYVGGKISNILFNH